MNLDQFQERASRTLPEQGAQHAFDLSLKKMKKASESRSGKAVIDNFYRDIDLTHAALGLAGEVGELVDPIKKTIFYGQPLKSENIKEEAGDILWYIAGPRCRALDCSMQELAEGVIAKLAKRYLEKYTDQAAQNRADKEPTK